MTPLRMKDAAWLSVFNTAGTEFPLRSRITTPNLPLAILVPGKAAITAICQVGGLDVAAEIAAINLGFLAFSAHNAALHFSAIPSAACAARRTRTLGQA